MRDLRTTRRRQKSVSPISTSRARALQIEAFEERLLLSVARGSLENQGCPNCGGAVCACGLGASSEAVVSCGLGDSLNLGDLQHHHHGHAHGTPLPDDYDPNAGPGGGGGSSGGGAGGPESSLSIPLLHSMPSASAFIYLDFDGHDLTNWGGFSGIESLEFDRDGTPGFSQSEIDEITEIWARVSEDFSPFNINVTTEDLGDYSPRVGMRVVISGDWTDWYGTAASGVAQVGSFTNAGQPNVVYVFEDVLNSAARVADIASHEAGHGFGLQHQSLYDGNGNKIEEYNPGGNPPGWAPIMGNPLSSTRSTWYNGTSTSSTTYQPDMSLIALPFPGNDFGFRTDDHSDIYTGATPLTFVAGQATTSGIIEFHEDIDYFSFSTVGGTVSFDLDVAQYGPNLDTVLTLYDVNDSEILSVDPSGTFDATLTTSVAAGDYYLAVSTPGVYGDTGQYSITATAPAVNSPPVADSGGPYYFLEGDSYILDASGSYDPDPGEVLSYAWDLDGDGQHDDHFGMIVQYDPGQLPDSEFDGPIVWNNVTVRVEDLEGDFDISPVTTVTYDNAPPVVSIQGITDILRGDVLALTFSATDASVLDQAAGFTFHIDWDGDGQTDEVSGGGITQYASNHLFSDAGTYDIGVTAVDKDGGVSQVTTHTVGVHKALPVSNPLVPSQTNLRIEGSPGSDIYVLQGDATLLTVTFLVDNGVVVVESQQFAGITGIIDIDAGDGDDTILSIGDVPIPYSMQGGLGNDILLGSSMGDTITGGPGGDLLSGLNGNDTLIGDEGADVLFGGLGADVLLGVDGEDLLLGDTNIYEDDPIALLAIRAEWSSQTAYLQRIYNLLGSPSGSHLNENYFLLPGVTVFDDGDADILVGGTELDWFFYSIFDQIFGQEPDEIAIPVGT